MLAHHVMQQPLGEESKVLDLCTGSGVVALAAAKRGARVLAVDVSRRAVLTARMNARLNGLEVDAVRSDLFSAVDGARFDLIVSNPPYLPGEDDGLPQRGAARAWEGGRSGREFIDRICNEAPEHLLPGGSVLLVHSSVCGVQATLRALSSRGLRARVVARRRGPLGPRLRARVGWLRQHGLLTADGQEEMLVISGIRDG